MGHNGFNKERKMKKALYGCAAFVLASCAVTSEESSMSPEQLAECLQPNRRAVVEIVGVVAKPPAKKPEAKPQEAKPDAPKPEAKPEADKAAADKPAPKPKVEMMPFEQSIYVQGNDAFDRGSAALKAGGQKEIDQLLATIKKRAVQVNAVIVAGHTDRLEAKSSPKSLSEDRAKAVKDFLVSRGINEKLIFWEGKEATQPVAVTKFCQ
jgi:outer membrane protein OmpA-like peptidoglycan-associated protein